MAIRHFLTLSGFEPENLSRIIAKSLTISRTSENGTRPLAHRSVGIYFKTSSTRTRTAFSVGASRLGAQTVHYGPNDLQLITGESIQDTGRVLSNFLDILVVRTNGSQAEMEALAAQNHMAIVNAMSEHEHPTQAITDLVTICEALGRLSDLHVLYIGEGNNSAVALAFAIARCSGMQLTLVTPEGYGVPDHVLKNASSLATQMGSSITQLHDLSKLPKGVDVVYTTRWQTMGVPKADPHWRAKFEPYRVTPELMADVSKPSKTIFMHDLPAIRGSEVANEVLDGPQSVAFRQAHHKLSGAMAILSWCAGIY